VSHSLSSIPPARPQELNGSRINDLSKPSYSERDIFPQFIFAFKIKKSKSIACLMFERKSLELSKLNFLPLVTPIPPLIEAP
jgi:hypothetical protein